MSKPTLSEEFFKRCHIEGDFKVDDVYPFNPQEYQNDWKLVWREKNLAIAQYEGYLSYYCGYCALENDIIPQRWHQVGHDAEGLQFLNIHGGVTYVRFYREFSVWGFDCAHAGDSENQKLQDIEYIKELTRQMEQQLRLFAEIYDDWQKKEKEERVTMIEEIRKQARIECEFGLGGYVDILVGRI